MRGCRLQFTRLSHYFRYFLSANCQRTLSSCSADAVQVVRLLALFDRFQRAAFRADVNGSSALIEEPSQKHAEMLPAPALRACVA